MITTTYKRVSGSVDSASPRGSWAEKRSALLPYLTNKEILYVEFGSLNTLFYPLDILKTRGKRVIFFLDDPDLINASVIDFLNGNESLLYFGGEGTLPILSKLRIPIRHVCFSSLLPQMPVSENNNGKAYYYGKLDAFRNSQLSCILPYYHAQGLVIDFVDKKLPTQQERAHYLRKNYQYALGLHDRKHENSRFYTGRIFNAIRYGIFPLLPELSWTYRKLPRDFMGMMGFLDDRKNELLEQLVNDQK